MDISSKGIAPLIIVLILLIVGASAAGGYFIYENYINGVPAADGLPEANQIADEANNETNDAPNATSNDTIPPYVLPPLIPIGY
jgi:hypothetical protein